MSTSNGYQQNLLRPAILKIEQKRIIAQAAYFPTNQYFPTNRAHPYTSTSNGSSTTSNRYKNHKCVL